MEYHKTVEIITNILKENNKWFDTFEHTEVRTSEEAAKIRPGYNLNQGSKALILKYKSAGNYNFVMFVMQGGDKLDSKKAKKLVNSSSLTFATPEEVAELTRGVKVGGVPPFGNIFGLKVYADSKLFNNEKIVFNAGDRCFSVAMYSKDYRELVSPEVVDLVI